MPEYCPHCGTAVRSVRREPGQGRPYEVWLCDPCEEEWRHPEETVLDKDLDFSGNGEQLSRRESDTDMTW